MRFPIRISLRKLCEETNNLILFVINQLELKKLKSARIILYNALIMYMRCNVNNAFARSAKK